MLTIPQIDNLMDISLSDKQLMHLIDNQANLILYPDLHKYNNIDKILGPYSACVILYESKPNYGHWCCIFKVNNNDIEFFNSYGDSNDNEGFPDGMMKFIPEEFQKISHQDHTYLSNLLINSPYNLSYNQYKFQGNGKNIKTCGRHVATRLNMRNLSLDNYYRFIKKFKADLDLNPDQAVTLLTSSINK